MRVAFVVQRCGAEVNGGAEALCLQIAQRMSRFWKVEILTTCAVDYVRWENHYPAGVEDNGGVPIRRFKVDRPRDTKHFDNLSGVLLAKGKSASLEEQEAWMRAQGPMSQSLLTYLQRSGSDYDAIIFFGYLYATTYFGLPLVKEKAYLAPLGHDEWPIHLTMWNAIFDMPRGFIFQTPEELAFLRGRFPLLALCGPVAGVGVEMPGGLQPGRFRERYGLKEPFLLYLGRIDASKGCGDMFDWFKQSRHTARDSLKLMLLGREVMSIAYHEDIICAGFVSEQEKWDAMAACDWLLLPSRYESLSIALLETWAAGRPAIVNAASEVLRGHCQRAHGGVWFNEWTECEAAVASIDVRTKDTLGRQGQKYVELNYTWARIEEAYLQAVPEIIAPPAA